jgi:acetyl-CoA carboxylase, biotin carboxylase subunit
LLQRVLVANRGEIAVRVVRAARELGIGVVTVHSDADEGALHTQVSDRSIRIGPAPSRESYLDQDRILEAAREAGCDAIHPGYGFLSENAGFARRVRQAGLAFVGPTPEAMEAMGDKTSARRNAAAAGVPIAPGSETLRDPGHARAEAGRVGYPVMLKASAGGGGIGMRVVRQASEMEGQFASASQQAAAAFGVPDLFLEKYLERPRHIEVQVLGDHHGNVIHLGERECSVQRRHQKVVEEAPSAALTQQERDEVGAKAVALARRVGYTNAGTMEFLHQDGAFFFNEMNTRLQVEHPVTEMVTGIDLVQWQLRIAGGEPLALRQEEVRFRGHAFEARINAEDPARGFAPCPGRVEGLRLPGGPGVRVDSGLREGWAVPPHYDSMVLKLVVHAGTREEACDRMLRALGELRVAGFETNRSLHQALFSHPAFRAGDLSTRFLEEHGILEALARAAEEGVRERRELAAAVAVALDALPGGLVAAHLRDSQPRPVAPGTRRDWSPA